MQIFWGNETARSEDGLPVVTWSFECFALDGEKIYLFNLRKYITTFFKKGALQKSEDEGKGWEGKGTAQQFKTYFLCDILGCGML